MRGMGVGKVEEMVREVSQMGVRNEVAIARFLAEGGDLTGQSISEQATIDQWMTWTTSFTQNKDCTHDNLTLINTLLSNRPFICGKNLSLPDIHFYLHSKALPLKAFKNVEAHRFRVIKEVQEFLPKKKDKFDVTLEHVMKAGKGLKMD